MPSTLSPRALFAAPAAIILCAPLLCGCSVGNSTSVSAENDRLRREVLELKDRVKQLEGDQRELVAKLTDRSAAAVAAVPAEVAKALPQVTQIEIESLSGLTPASRSVPATGIILYLSPSDSKGRFTQIVGTLKVEALGLPRGVASSPTAPILASVTLTPTQLRDAYRAGLTGTHYSIELPLDSPLDRRAGAAPDLLLRAEFIDAVSGQTYRTDRIILSRP